MSVSYSDIADYLKQTRMNSMNTVFLANVPQVGCFLITVITDMMYTETNAILTAAGILYCCAVCKF